MNTTVDIDGIPYHAREVYDDDGVVIDTVILTDEYGKPIPATVCICHAFEPNECCCGAWDDVTDWYYND